VFYTNLKYSDNEDLPLVQCRNWDGGKQEFNTAASCVKAVFPDCDLVENRVDKAPIRVTIWVEANGSKTKVWEGRQQALFSKNRSDREKSMAEVKASLTDLKEELDL